MHNFENLAHLKNFLNSLNEDELKQPFRFWGDNIGGRITGAEILHDDYINPSGECLEPRLPYLPGGELYDEDFDMEDEAIVLSKGTIVFEVDCRHGMSKDYEECPTCTAPVRVAYALGTEQWVEGQSEMPLKKNFEYKYAGR